MLTDIVSSSTFTGRIHVIHGHRDNIVPFKMGKELSLIDSKKISLVSVKSAGHNDLLGFMAHYAKILSD
jgi:fermentation-respiration switch protein FrsA (DUF1100 family)